MQSNVEKEYLQLPRSRSSSVSTQDSAYSTISMVSQTEKNRLKARKADKFEQDSAPMVIRKASAIPRGTMAPRTVDEDLVEGIFVAPEWHHLCDKQARVGHSVIDCSRICFKPGACSTTNCRNHWMCSHVEQTSIDNAEIPARRIYGDMMKQSAYVKTPLLSLRKREPQAQIRPKTTPITSKENHREGNVVDFGLLFTPRRVSYRVEKALRHFD